MKKSTLIVLLLAAGLGGFVYYYEVKRSPRTEKVEDESKLAFSFLATDISSITLERGGESVAMERKNDAWVITLPIDTRADQSAVNGIADGLAAARISRTFPATPERLSAFGLNSPAVKLSFTRKSGQKHEVQFGAKDFSGMYAYAVIDTANEVVLLPESLLVSSDKTLSDLRDHAVMNISAGDVTSFELKNKSGDFAASKLDANWHISKPRAGPADSSAIGEMLGQVAVGRWDSLVSETSDRAAQYGLDHPQITLDAISTGGKSSALVIGKKEGETYFARDTSRPMIFRIKNDPVQHLSKTLFDLRDKSLVHFRAADLARLEIQNGKDKVVCTQGSEGAWKIEEPADKKGKAVLSYKFTEPLEAARAKEILDAPPPDVTAMLAKPAVRLTLTLKSGKKTEVSVSNGAGDFVYAKTSESSAVLKLDKQTLTDLSLKASDLAE